MSDKQTINDLLMEVAKLRKDNDYLSGELGYWKQQAGHDDTDHDSVYDGDSRERLIEDIRDFSHAVTNVDKEYFGEIVCDVIRFIDRQAAITRAEWCNEKGWWDSARACNDATAACYEKDERIAELEAELNRTCTLAYDGKWLTCSACGESLQWFGVRTVYKTDGKQEQALGVEGVRYCPFCGARIEEES